jgi:hypothetical protein
MLNEEDFAIFLTDFTEPAVTELAREAGQPICIKSKSLSVESLRLTFQGNQGCAVVPSTLVILYFART